MDVTGLPFNQLIGLQRSDQPDKGDLMLEGLTRYHNHLGTVHAAAQFALAEAAGGEYLLREFAGLAEGHVALVRAAQIKYRQAASGRLYAQAQAGSEARQKFEADLSRRGRAFLSLDVSVLDESGTVTMTATFDWYAQRAETTPKQQGDA